MIVETPADYDSDTSCFDITSVEAGVAVASCFNLDGTVVIKSTMPLSYTRQLPEQLSLENIIFSPEFLRKGRALYDNLHASSIGERSQCLLHLYMKYVTCPVQKLDR